MPITLTNENYYSDQANIDYMSVSQFKDFAGTTDHTSCEETALLKLKGLIPNPETEALLVGSYIDSYYEGTLDEFIKTHPQIISSSGSTKGQPKAAYKKADAIIERLNRDRLFSQFMSGDKQVIMTGNLFGTDWKIKMDSYHPTDKIVDLKVMKDIKPIWSDTQHRKIDFIHYWGYDIQGAIYQKIVEINTGYRLPFYIAVATKEDLTDFNIIEITQPHLDTALEFVEQRLPRVLAIKNGTIQPDKCGHCSHCMDTRVLTTPITIDDIMPALPKSGFEDFEE